MFIRNLFSGKSAKETGESSNKWQYKLHLAQISPEPDLDLTDCTLKCLPKGIYGQCRIFRKNRLLLSDNCLSTLPDDTDNSLVDLIGLCTFLDISRNRLNSLPPNLGNLVNLKELHLSHNTIKLVPESLMNLKNLETINISHNQLLEFPRCFCDMTNLKHIDISYNQLITRLPPNICNLMKLEKLIIVGTSIKHPPKRICDQGIESLRKFFTNVQLNDQQVNQIETTKSPEPDQVQIKSTSPNEDRLQAYLAKKDNQKRQFIEFEKNLLEENKLIGTANRKMVDKRQEILTKMKKDQEILQNGLDCLFAKRIEDKSSVTKALALIEKHSAQLVEQLKALRERPKNSEEIDDQLMSSLETKLQQLLISKDLTKESLQTKLIAEDESLYRAICAFAKMKNTQSRILSEQIRLVQHELYHLTKAEIQRRNNNIDQQTTNINGQRVALASLLKDLVNERNDKLKKREDDSSILSNFIEKVTSSTINDQSDQILKGAEKIDPHLNQLLDDLDSSLSELYLPILTRNSMTLRRLATSTNDELESLGIRDAHTPIIRKLIDLHLPKEQLIAPSAPQLAEISPKPSAPPMKLYQLIECVICLDDQSKIILIPCGHVCACLECSKSLESCPLCRSEISEKIESN